MWFLAKKDNLKIEFVGLNAEDVTGSMTWVHDKNLSILLECGLYQSNDMLEDFKANSRKLKFSAKKVDFIILGHIHADHSMLIPRLYAEGCKARIIMPKGTKGFYKLMGQDSAYIIDRDCCCLEKQHNKPFRRIYTEKDVLTSLDYIEEYPMGEKIELSDRLQIQFTPSGHIINAAQIECWVKNEIKNKTTKILYTSDLGNLKTTKYYANTFQRVEKANIVIGECTYNDKKPMIKSDTRKKDLIKMREIIKNSEGIVEIPIFALDRGPNILTMLYDIFGEDKDFTTDVIVDSPLAVKMLHEYENVLEGESAEKLNKVLNWSNVRLISEYEDSKEYMLNCKRAVVLTAAGMLSKGRSRTWLKHIIEDEKNCILFVGYASENTLAYSIKKAKRYNSRIKIDGHEYKNRCKIVDLKSFTSHMQYDDLLNYYSSICSEKVCLVHGNKGKVEFSKVLQELIQKKGGHARVVCVNSSTKVNL